MIKIASFLLPTRERYDWLIQSLESILNNADNFENFDILLAMDFDDVDTINNVEKYIENNNLQNIIKLYKFERQYYLNLHVYINELSKISESKYLILWNDDAQITTPKWDIILKEHIENQDVLYVYEILNNHFNNIFPIIPKEWVNIIGHFSENAHNDTWVEIIAKELNVLKDIPINANHYRSKIELINSEIYKEVNDCLLKSRPEFYSLENTIKRQKDLIKLKNALYINYNI
jgi:hypothetical protein